MKLRDLIEMKLLAPIAHRFTQPEELEFPEGTNVHEGPFYSNRAMRRQNGERGYGHGLGRMDIRTGRSYRDRESLEEFREAA